MTLKLIDNPEALAKTRDQWNEVSGNHPFQSWEWCHNWYQNMAPDCQPAVIHDGDWSGIVPMVRCQTKLGANKIFFMGSGTACTDYANLIAKEGNYQLFLSKFTHLLKSQRSTGQYEVVEFEGMELDSPLTRHLVNAMIQAGYHINALTMESCWKLSLPEDWNSLNKQFSKKHRRKTKKAVSRLADQRTEVQFASIQNFESIWDSFVDLHQRRRQMTQQTGCFANPEFETFLRRSAKSLIERDLCELIQISVDGKPMAATLLFHDQQNAFMYQTGFNPDFRDWEPGYMLIVQSLKRSISRGFKTFDFLRGNEPYKARWNTTEVPLVKLRCVTNSSLTAVLRDFAWREYIEFRRKAKWLKSNQTDPKLVVISPN